MRQVEFVTMDCVDKGQIKPSTSVHAVPHPVPYQGSKRLLANRILKFVPPGTRRIVEPFCGSAAMSLAAIARELVEEVWIADIWPPLVQLWQDIVNNPEGLARAYGELWEGQHEDPRKFYLDIRARFNTKPDSGALLYLLARCVKNSVRLNPRGEFNQSADHRRMGTKPATMRCRIVMASRLLRGRCHIEHGDFRDILSGAVASDFVYLDPPYQGVNAKDARYVKQLSSSELVDALNELNRRSIAFALSYDGRCGDREYGPDLSAQCDVHRVELFAGRSSQATLLGRSDVTVESLYLSPELRRRSGSTACEVSKIAECVDSGGSVEPSENDVRRGV